MCEEERTRRTKRGKEKERKNTVKTEDQYPLFLTTKTLCIPLL